MPANNLPEGRMYGAVSIPAVARADFLMKVLLFIISDYELLNFYSRVFMRSLR